MKRDTNEIVDRYRRALLRSGFALSAGALALRHGASLAEETLTYPSADEILPKEWGQVGECIFTAVAEEGPYFVEGSALRRDIRDGEEGQELVLRFEVVDVVRCIALPEALVQIWHCNAGGWYSGYANADPDVVPTSEGLANHVPPQSPERFLRGAQVSDAHGKCEFVTIYPGWYAGRTVHVHAKVHFNDSRLITSQLYFPQRLNDEIHQTGLYRGRGVSPYRNSSDIDIRMSGGAAGSWPAITRERNRYVATLRIGVLNPHFDHIAPA